MVERIVKIGIILFCVSVSIIIIRDLVCHNKTDTEILQEMIDTAYKNGESEVILDRNFYIDRSIIIPEGVFVLGDGSDTLYINEDLDRVFIFEKND